jgi:hypothetical protein
MSDLALAGHHILQLDDSPQSRHAVVEALTADVLLMSAALIGIELEYFRLPNGPPPNPDSVTASVMLGQPLTVA